MRSFAMILDNPGEQPHATRYRDPVLLRDLGYTDLIIYSTTGLSGLLGPDTLSSPDLRQWVADQYDRIQQTAADAARAGLGVWLTYDAPSLARELVGTAMTLGPDQPIVLNPASDELLEMCGQCLEALLSRIDPVDGIVLRLGDNDAAKVGYLVGNDIYSPRGSAVAGMGRAERLVRFIRYFHGLVVGKLGRSLIVRAWNVKPGGMHDDPQLCRRVVERLPDDPRLLLSFKFTQTDFWRYQPWNPGSLACGDRPIIYELQCQREFEGKGAVPNYQVPLWRDGMKELEGAVGLADVAGRINLAGLWAWVRGGGWRGPYVDSETETWIDANVTAVPKLAADPRADPAELARSWVTQRLGVTADAAVRTICRVLEHSPQTALETFYIGPYARGRHDPWHPSGDVVQDDQIDADALWTVMQQLSEKQMDEAVAEKLAAEQRLAADRQELRRIADQLDRPLRETLPASLEYHQSLVQTLRSLITGLAAYRRWTRKPEPTLAQAAEKAMRAAQSCWVHHTQRIAVHSGASAFGSDNLWDLTQRITDRLGAAGAASHPN